MAQPVDFVLIHQGEGVIERSSEDVFTEEYVRKIFHTPGKYKVMERKDHGDYKTSKKVRDFELRMYSAEPDKGSNVIEAKIKDFEAKRESNWAGAEEKKQQPVISASSAAPAAEKPIPTDMRIIRKAGSDELMVVDGDDKEVYSGFTFDDLKRAKQGFSGEDKIVKKDLNNQSFIKYVLVFLAGAVIGALGTFAILNQKHQKEIAAVYAKLDTLQQQIQQQQQQSSAPKKKDFNSWLVGEYNGGVGGPDL